MVDVSCRVSRFWQAELRFCSLPPTPQLLDLTMVRRCLVGDSFQPLFDEKSVNGFVADDFGPEVYQLAEQYALFEASVIVCKVHVVELYKPITTWQTQLIVDIAFFWTW